MSRRLGGTINFKIDGQMYQAKGNFSWRINPEKKEQIVGSDGVHGHKAMPQVPYIEGAITDSPDMSVEELQAIEDATVILELANGKIISLEQACYAHEGEGTTEEGEIAVRFEGIKGKEVR